MNIITTDTICAICTPPGRGAIATLRLSGPDAIDIADKVFRSARDGKRLADQRGGTLHYGTLADATGRAIDEVMVAIMRAPHSFTGDDTAEISCHGSTIIQQRILETLIDAGARMAGPGEFSKRAFANGKMDLSQAEAVADLIASGSEAARRVALNQLRGGFSRRLSELRDKLVQFASLLELELDFSEEDVEFADRSELTQLVTQVRAEVTALADSFRRGNAIKEGVPTAIVGAPNVGKSTLLNALLCEERAIVSDIRGTTRDTIEECLTVGDMTFRLIDTAGLRETEDVIEAEGIRRSRRAAERATIIIVMADATEGEAAARAAIEDVRQLTREGQSLIAVINKCDACPTPWATDEWRDTMGAAALCTLSAREGNGMESLRQAMTECAGGNESDEGDTVIVTNIRHYEALRTAADALNRVQEGLATGLSGEFVALDLRDVTNALGSITGQIGSQEVLNNIFAKFCIGK